MRTTTLISRLCIVCLVLFISVSASSQLKKTYLINKASQLSGGPIYFSGCGTNHYSDDYYVGFKWTDNLPAGASITNVKIEVNVGLEYNSGNHVSVLNGNSQGDVMTTDYYDCDDRTFITEPSINIVDYNSGGQNEFLFEGQWGSTYLCKTPDLSNSFARITVTYIPSFPGGAAPTISSFTPTNATPCSNVTIYGSNFDNNLTYVQFNETTTTSFAVVSPTELIATVPANATDGPITVYNNGGYETSVDNFTVNTPPPPSISNVTPTVGTVGSTIVITGTDLSCATAITVGGSAVSSFTVNSITQITAIVGYGTTGDIEVTTPGGTASFSSFTYNAPSNSTQMNISGTGSTNAVIASTASVVDPGLVVTGNGLITDFTVSISDTYTSGDELSYQGDLPSAITTDGFNSSTGVIIFKGSMLAADWQAFLRNITFTSTSDVCFPEKRKISFTAGNKFYNPLTGHFYEYMQTSMAWSDARQAAASTSYYGRQGYLATITSQAENNFIWKIMNADAWVGGTDNYAEINAAVGYTLFADAIASEGRYYWVTGPEKGQQFSNQNAYEPGGVQPVNGKYSNWSGGEPNDYPGDDISSPGEEDYVEIYATTWGSGTWNDLPNSSTLSYIIEYGDMPNDNLSNQVVFTRELSVSGASSGTITGGNVTVCDGTNSTNLTLTNFTGTVDYWESSADNFLTPATFINNTSTSLTVDNITETTYYRAIVTSSSPASCSGLSTSSIVITVAKTEPGTIAATNNTICEGSNTELTLFGNKGDVLKWQVATDAGFSLPDDINNTTTSLTHTLVTAGNYYFRALVQNNGCGSPVWSDAFEIIVNSGTAPIGGIVDSKEHTAGNNSGTLTLSGYTGTVEKWQSSVDNGLVWVDVSNAADSYNYNVSSTTLYRAVVSNAGCGNANSAAGTVTILNNNQFKWYGTNDDDWQDNGNWLSGSKPGSGADVIIAGNAMNDLLLDQSYDVNSIDFSGSGIKVVLANHDLSVNNIIGANSSNYIITNGTGKLKINIANSGSVSFPVGNSAYNPVSITNNTGATDAFTVRVLDEVYTNGSDGATVTKTRVRHTWDIGKTNSNNGSGLDFTFNWNNGETSGSMITPSLFHYSGTWDKQSGSTSSTANSLSYIGYTGSFSPFSIMEGTTTLPLNWLSFTVQKQNDAVLLKWVTGNEQNTKDFIVQHSINGTTWTNIGSVDAAGNSAALNNYSFLHTAPLENKNYYRILQRDLDGKSSFSRVLSMTITKNNSLTLMGNPVQNGSLQFRLNNTATVSLFNETGQLLLTQKFMSGVHSIDVAGYANGAYLIKTENESKRFVIVKR